MLEPYRGGTAMAGIPYRNVSSGVMVIVFSVFLFGCECKPVRLAQERGPAVGDGGTGVPAPAAAGAAVPVDAGGHRVALRTEESEASPARLARRDPVGFLEYCLRQYRARYRDYTCTFLKQERIGGTLGPVQTIDAKYRDEPFSVVLRWAANAPAGDLAIYVEGENDGKVLVHPKGLASLLINCVRIDPAGEEAMEHSLFPITQFGFRRALETLIERNRQAEGRSEPEWGGRVTIQETGRPAFLLIRDLPGSRDGALERTRTWIDVQYLVPTRIEGYDGNGELDFRYVYTDVRFNQGLTASDFAPEANGISCPR